MHDFECLNPKCGYKFIAPAGPQDCVRCGHDYVVNYTLGGKKPKEKKR